MAVQAVLPVERARTKHVAGIVFRAMMLRYD